FFVEEITVSEIMASVIHAVLIESMTPGVAISPAQTFREYRVHITEVTRDGSRSAIPASSFSLNATNRISGPYCSAQSQSISET
ncbi:MAG: hypothetical protein ABGZ23_18405, partial [Fuerstiella sp.]